MNKFISYLFFVGLFFAWQAGASCSFDASSEYPMNSVVRYSAPILGNMIISVPNDAEVGTVIYKQNIKLQNAMKSKIVCTSIGDFETRLEYLLTPKSKSTYNSVIYETGLQGIGVQFTVNETLNLPFQSEVGPCQNTIGCTPATKWYFDAQFALIKIAKTVSAGTIAGSNLPSVKFSFGQSNSMLAMQEVAITGNITVTTPTCNIATSSGSMTVPMGNYYINSFAGKGSGTEWKDASIKLINCGRFYGESSTSMATYNGANNTDTILLPNNMWSMNITPYNGIIDTAKGIIDLDNDSSRATGIGIQLSTAQSTTGLVNLSAPVKGALPNDGSQNITIPLYARYIQTGNSVSAGKANGKLMYTITYQ